MSVEHLSRVKTLGETYNRVKLVDAGKTLLENNNEYSVNPNTGSIGTPHNCSITYGIDDKYLIDDLHLDFTLSNLHTTDSITFKNPFLVLNSIELQINNKEVYKYENQESIYVAVSNYLKDFDENERWAELQKCRNELTKTFSGETTAALSSSQFSIPLYVLFPFLDKFSPVYAINKLEFKFSFATQGNSVSETGRFVISSGATNIWTSSFIKFENIKIRQSFTRLSNPDFFMLKNPVGMMRKFDVRKYEGISWNSLSDSITINLNSDFTMRNHISHIHLYLYPNSLITATNDADCCKVYSNHDVMNLVVKYKTKEIVKLDNKLKMVQYMHATNERRHGQPLIHSIVSNSDEMGNYFLIGCSVDLTGLTDTDKTDLVSGTNNSSRDYEIVVKNSKGAWATSATLVAVLEYQEILTVVPNNAIVSV
jgi:hypothetical protein